jgi:hypothetical protein
MWDCSCIYVIFHEGNIANYYERKIIRKDDHLSKSACGQRNSPFRKIRYESPMIDYQKFIQRNSRRIYASAALVAALFAASILLNSGPTGTAWIIKNSISSGSLITAQDIATVKVNLATDSAHYLSDKDLVVGQFATRTLNPGDLISISDLTRTSGASEVRYLPLGIALNDLPIALSAGDHADIYVIPKQASLGPALVVSNVSIHQIDNKSRALGGNIEIEVSVGLPAAMNLVDAESQGRLVVSRHAF